MPPVEAVLKRQRIFVKPLIINLPLPALPVLLHKLSLHFETSFHVLNRHDRCISQNGLILSTELDHFSIVGRVDYHDGNTRFFNVEVRDGLELALVDALRVA